MLLKAFIYCAIVTLHADLVFYLKLMNSGHWDGQDCHYKGSMQATDGGHSESVIRAIRWQVTFSRIFVHIPDGTEVEECCPSDFQG